MAVQDTAARYFAAINAHDADALSQLFAEDAWLRPPRPIEEMQGREAIRSFYATSFAATPDLQIEPDVQYFVDGNECVARFWIFMHGARTNAVIDVFTANDRDELVDMTAYARL